MLLIKNDRREFLRKTFSSCAFCCFAAPIAFGSDRINPIAPNQKHKFESDSGMTMQQVFNFALQAKLHPCYEEPDETDREGKFLEMLKKSSEMQYESDENA